MFKCTIFSSFRQSGFLLYEMVVTLGLLAGAAYALAQLAQQGYQQYHAFHRRTNACRVIQSVIGQVRSGVLACSNHTGRHGDEEYCVVVGKKITGLTLVPLRVMAHGVSVETMVLCA